MLRMAFRVAAALLLTSALAFAWIWNSRRLLPYNEEGRYFDAASAVVLHEQSVGAYGVLALTLALIGATCWLVSRKV